MFQLHYLFVTFIITSVHSTFETFLTIFFSSVYRKCREFQDFRSIDICIFFASTTVCFALRLFRSFCAFSRKLHLSLNISRNKFKFFLKKNPLIGELVELPYLYRFLQLIRVNFLRCLHFAKSSFLWFRMIAWGGGFGSGPSCWRRILVFSVKEFQDFPILDSYSTSKRSITQKVFFHSF